MKRFEIGDFVLTRIDPGDSIEEVLAQTDDDCPHCVEERARLLRAKKAQEIDRPPNWWQGRRPKRRRN